MLVEKYPPSGQVNQQTATDRITIEMTLKHKIMSYLNHKHPELTHGIVRVNITQGGDCDEFQYLSIFGLLHIHRLHQ